MIAKDYTKYKFNGKEYGKGRLVLSIVKEYVKQCNNIIFSDLKRTFPDDLQKSTVMQFSSKRVVFEEKGAIQEQEEKRFFMDGDDLVSLNDCIVCVSREWNHENIKVFIKRAALLGVSIKTM